MWSDLPEELRLVIWGEWADAGLATRACVRVQRAWRGYRTRVLLGRFGMLRYLKSFREWDPPVATFLLLARL